MGTCNAQRIHVGLTALFIVTTIVLVGVLIWRELRDVEKEVETDINEQTVTKIYPGFFRTLQDQTTLFQQYEKSFYFNRTAVTDKFYKKDTCKFNCESTVGRKRRKRAAISSVINHGCCQSWLSFEFPDTKVSIGGKERTILQYPALKQFFIIHHCSTMDGCTGCFCSQEDVFYSAVVHKIGVEVPEDVDDTEVDWFKLDGCCKCVNT